MRLASTSSTSLVFALGLLVGCGESGRGPDSFQNVTADDSGSGAESDASGGTGIINVPGMPNGDPDAEQLTDAGPKSDAPSGGCGDGKIQAGEICDDGNIKS